jgi:hypothetical protein
LASDSFSKVNEQILNLELILKCGAEHIKRVTIELNIDETADFVGKLKQIEKELLGSM